MPRPALLTVSPNPSEPQTLKDIPEDSRPRERLLRCGGKSLSDAELIAILLRSGRPGQSAIAMAQDVLDGSGGILGLVEGDFTTVHRQGLGRAKAATLLAAVELARRIARARIPQRQLLDRPDTVAAYLTLRYGRSNQEVMGAVYLDVRRRLLADVDFFHGTLDRAAVEPQPILKEALRRNASSFVLFHTHPSGDPSPSAEDLQFTRRLAKAGDVLGIEMVDHLILGSAGRWVSLKRRGTW